MKYEIVLYWSSADEVFIAEVPELPGCVSRGDSYEEALANAKEAMSQWIAGVQKDGQEPPLPLGQMILRPRYRDSYGPKKWSESDENQLLRFYLMKTNFSYIANIFGVTKKACRVKLYKLSQKANTQGLSLTQFAISRLPKLNLITPESMVLSDIQDVPENLELTSPQEPAPDPQAEIRTWLSTLSQSTDDQFRSELNSDKWSVDLLACLRQYGPRFKRERTLKIADEYYGDSKRTLEKIGIEYELTRERIRQILDELETTLSSETTFFGQMLELRLSYWASRFDSLLTTKRLVAADPWFHLFSQATEKKLQRFLNSATHGNWYCFAWTGETILSRWKSSDLNELVAHWHEILDSQLGNITVSKLWDDIKSYTKANEYPEVKYSLFKHLLDELIVSKEEEPIILGWKGPLINYCVAAIRHTGRTMQLEQIAKWITVNGERDINTQQVRSAMLRSSSVIMVDRRTYSLPGIDNELEAQVDEVVTYAEEIISRQPARQWHSYELISIMNEYIDLPEFMNNWIMDYMLSHSEFLVKLGRHIWTWKKEEGFVPERLFIYDIVTQILLLNGEPMLESDIWEVVEKERGLNRIRQLTKGHLPLIKMDGHRWGLVDRDTGITRNSLDKIPGILTNLLEGRTSITISETTRKLRTKHEFKSLTDDLLTQIIAGSHDFNTNNSLIFFQAS